MIKFTKQSSILTIILNWNGAQDTLECLDSLKKINTKTDILIIDNGSEKKDIDILENIKTKYNLNLLFNKTNAGFAKANNQGMQYAMDNNYEYILLLNNDTIVQENFLEFLLQELINRPKAAMAAPKIYYANSNKIWHTGGKLNKITAKANGLFFQNEIKTIETGIDFLSGCCLLIKATALKDIGLFDEKFFAYLEDADLCRRALDKGWNLVYVPNAVIWHKVSQSTGGSAFKPIPLFLRIRNRIIYQKKYANLFIYSLFLVYHVIYVCFIIFYGIFTFNFKISKAAIKGFIFGLNNKKL